MVYTCQNGKPNQTPTWAGNMGNMVTGMLNWPKEAARVAASVPQDPMECPAWP